MKTLSELLTELGWSFRHLADELGVNERTVRRWSVDPNYPMPSNVYAWLDLLAEPRRICPFPEGWVRHREALTMTVLPRLSSRD